MTNINESISSSGLMVRSFTVYKFLTLLSSPFSTFDAFRKGIIDARGNYIKDMDEAFRNGSLDPLEVIIIKLKKIIATSSDPGLKSSLSNNLATFDMFLNEMYRYNILPHESLYLLESHCLKKGFSVIDTLIEDMSVGAGGIPGLSITDIVGPKKRRKKSPMFRRNELMEMEVTTPSPTTPTPEVSPQLDPIPVPGMFPSDVIDRVRQNSGGNPSYERQIEGLLEYYQNLLNEYIDRLSDCLDAGGNCQSLIDILLGIQQQIENLNRIIDMLNGNYSGSGGQVDPGQGGGDSNPPYNPLGDDDGDGILNKNDTDNIYYNPYFGDQDNDGIPDINDPDSTTYDINHMESDADNDGIPNMNDPDHDNYNPGISDQDGDGINDINDPDSPYYEPDHHNSDDDGDGIANVNDPDHSIYDINHPYSDEDGDGTRNGEDIDSPAYSPFQGDQDNDGIVDAHDPDSPTYDPNSWGSDADNDGVPNYGDMDHPAYDPDFGDQDNDGLSDTNDPDDPAYDPNDPLSDADNDGIPNLNDTDNQGYDPYDPNSDADNDGISNENDPDFPEWMRTYYW